MWIIPNPIWDKIKHKTKYQVDYKTDELIEQSAEAISDLTITSPRLVSRRARLEIDETGVEGNVVSELGHKIDAKIGYIPDVLGYIQGKTRLTRDTILKILKKSGMISDILKNPQQFLDLSSNCIIQIMKKMMVDGIKYEKIANQYWEMALFENEELEHYLEDLYPVQNKSKTLYNYVYVESNVERTFAKALEDRDDVRFYFKLPFWFKINTPLGTYNPDWAIVFEGDKKLYFIAETKSEGEELRESEQMKIKCGKRHFKLFKGLEFKAPISKVSQIQINS